MPADPTVGVGRELENGFTAAGAEREKIPSLRERQLQINQNIGKEAGI